jgi:hypothetical protein
MSRFRHHRPNLSERRARLFRLGRSPRPRRRLGLTVLTTSAVAAIVLPVAVPAAVQAPAPNAPIRNLVRIVMPADNALVTKPRAKLVVHVTGPVRLLRAYVDQRHVPLHRISETRFAGVATGLHVGANVLRVEAVAPNGGSNSASVVVTSARRQRGLVRLRAPRRGASPIAVSVRVPRQEVRFHAWLNGKLIDRSFPHALRGVRRATLSASDHLRYGRNKLKVLVVGDSRLRNSATYDVVERTFFVPRERPLVGAGRDITARAGSVVRFDGRASRPHVGAGLTYRWRVLERPKGSNAALRRATAARPSVATDQPGRYRLALVTRVSPGSGTSLGAAAPSKADVVTADATPSYPLLRLRANVPMGDHCFGITIGPDQVGVGPQGWANLTCQSPEYPGVSVLAFDRKTLGLVDQRSLGGANDVLEYVLGLKQTYTAATGPLVVINVDPAYFAATGNATGIFGEPDFNDAIRLLGAWGYPSGVVESLGSPGALIVGVPGWRPGDGFQSANPGDVAPMSLTGFLTVTPGENGRYRFQPAAGQVGYKTAYGGDSNAGPGQMVIAGNKYAMTPHQDPAFIQGVPAWRPGDPYVHLVAVRADAPDVGSPTTGSRPLERAFAINTIQCTGDEQLPAVRCTFDHELGRMSDTLETLAGDRSVLVFVQTVGSVYRYAEDSVRRDSWYEVGDALDKLGGSAWVWDNMPTLSNQTGNANTYALVGGQAIVDETRPEATELGGQIPDPWTGGAGPTLLEGVLALNNFGWFTPTHHMPAGVWDIKNDFGPSLTELAYGEPQSWPAMDTPEKRAAYAWINSHSSDIHVTGDVRTAYYTGTYNDKWGDQVTNLETIGFEAGHGFEESDLAAVKAQLSDEFNYLDDVNQWFTDLRDPLVTTQGKSTVDITTFTKKIKSALQPKSSATSEWLLWAFSLLGDLTGFGELAEGTIGETFAAASQAIETSTTIAENPNAAGEPLEGQVESTMELLTDTIEDNTDATFAAMETLRKIIVSDWGKLSQIGLRVEKGARWHANDNQLMDAKNNLEVGIVRQGYDAVLPVVGDVLQFWPATSWHANNRRVDQLTDLRCNDGGTPFVQNEKPPASSVARLSLWYDNYYETLAQTRPPWSFLALRIKGDFKEGKNPSSTMTDPLITPPAPNGVYADTPLPNPGYYLPWLLGRQLPVSQYSNC